MHIMLLIGLTGVCVVWYVHLLLRLRAPIGVCGVCVRREDVCCGMPLTAQCGCHHSITFSIAVRKSRRGSARLLGIQYRASIVLA